MNELESRNFEMLREGPCSSSTYIRDYYGLPWPLPGDSLSSFEAWRTRFAGHRAACGDGASRHELERYMKHQSVLPKKWAAARMGMDVDSLDGVLARLPDLGMRPQRYVFDDVFVADSFIDDLTSNLRGVRLRTFSDHDSFCRQLQGALEEGLGIGAARLICETSKRIGEYPARFARYFDCVTMEPLSGRHGLWLDFRKPLYLPPDRCSKLFYAEYREELRPFLAGGGEPDDLESYSRFLAGHPHA